MRVDAHVGPVVLVAEVVGDLQREIVLVRGVRGGWRGWVGFEKELKG